MCTGASVVKTNGSVGRKNKKMKAKKKKLHQGRKTVETCGVRAEDTIGNTSQP